MMPLLVLDPTRNIDKNMKHYTACDNSIQKLFNNYMNRVPTGRENL